MLSQATVQQLINFFVRILIDRNAKCIDFISDCLKYYYFEVGCISRGVRWAIEDTFVQLFGLLVADSVRLTIGLKTLSYLS